MQMCAVDKDLKREHAADAGLLSTRTQRRLRLDIQLDLEGGEGGRGEEPDLCTDLSAIVS